MLDPKQTLPVSKGYSKLREKAHSMCALFGWCRNPWIYVSPDLAFF